MPDTCSTSTPLSARSPCQDSDDTCATTPQTEQSCQSEHKPIGSMPISARFSPTKDGPPNDPIEIPKIMSDFPTAVTTTALAKGLEGKCVDEFGNILDWNGTVLGRVEGDLPSMVGRPVCADGKILDSLGEVSGYVSENFISPPPSPELEPSSRKRIKIDHYGTIYDDKEDVLSKMNDHGRDDAPKVETTETCESCRARRDEEKRKQKTSTADGSIPRQGPAAPSPSEIYLDVKSTHDGIQLIIKIPTVFRDHQEKPRAESRSDTKNR